MWRYRSSLPIIGLSAAVALSAGGCSGTAPATTLLTQQTAAEVAEGMALDAEGEMAEATATGAVASFSDAPAAGNLGLAAPTCTITVTPASPTLSASGVPDSVSMALNGCVLSYPAESGTMEGTLIVQDPNPTVVHTLAEERTYQGVERIRERSNVLSTETWNGVRNMTSATTTTLTESETNFSTQFALPDGNAPVHTRTWTSVFTPDQGGTIAANTTLPSGSWNISGSGQWRIGSTTYAVAVSTTTALHFNSACTATPRFDAGVLQAVLTLSGQTGTVVITFGPCGTASGKNS